MHERMTITAQDVADALNVSLNSARGWLLRFKPIPNMRGLRQPALMRVDEVIVRLRGTRQRGLAGFEAHRILQIDRAKRTPDPGLPLGADPARRVHENNLLRQPHVKARIDYLKRERASKWDDFEDDVFDGFEELLNGVLDNVAELVRACDGNDLAREAAQARDVLTTISSRVLAQLHSLRAADKQQVVRTDNLIQTLESFSVVKQ